VEQPFSAARRAAYNLLVKIYTRTGDSGETGLFDGQRVSKSDPRVDAYGEVDELNAALGLVLAEPLDGDVAEMLHAIQRDLFALGGRLADPSGKIASRVEKVQLGGEEVARLEGWIDQLESELPALRRFILPGGSRTGALLHGARTICRRAERRIVLVGAHAVDPGMIAYTNRLSDFLFVVARAVNRRAGAPEIEW
jgi:cob(I)alamin adenosyltransferase